ncbi:DUF1501 domain-containing protein [Rapidithrix thailandica]|uniref:DUF1501 domain-containing protein n=1 Tax=Rapidithrix thailandica TaxID=413964 RepID=A0AAW9RXC8_9BACT
MKTYTNRRRFLKNSALATAGASLIPGFLKAFERQQLSPAPHEREKILVVVQLSGGNDGLNTVIPYRNDIYYRSRPNIALPKEKVLNLNGEQGLHPSLLPLKRLYDQGWLSILNEVGYPNPDRSHFRSMDIWQTGSSASEYWNTGWLGRYLDACCQGHPHQAIDVDDTLSLALKGKQVKGLAMHDPKKLSRMVQQEHIQTLTTHYKEKPPHDNTNLHYLYKTLSETVSSAEYLQEKVKKAKSSQDYPQSAFAKNLQTIAQLINAGASTKVYYTSLSGFDTHVNQDIRQKRMLESYASGIEAFVKDLQQGGTFEEVLILTFSEFGRRVEENASKGTDHGTANNLFVIGKSLKQAGVYNPAPNLTQLDHGDLIYSIDFREVYASILEKWLDLPGKQVLGRAFQPLNFL